MKICSRCKEKKPLVEFDRDVRNLQGRRPECKTCRATGSRITAEKDLATTAFQRIKASSYRKGFPLLISLPEFREWYLKQNGNCYYCDIPGDFAMKIFKSSNGTNVDGLENDRMDSTKPYTLDNIVRACHRCNVCKNHSFTAKEFRQVAQQFIKPKWQKIFASKQTIIPTYAYYHHVDLRNEFIIDVFKKQH